MWILGRDGFTYRLVGTVGLCQGCGSTVDLLDHAGKILAHLIQVLGKLLRQFVSGES